MLSAIQYNFWFYILLQNGTFIVPKCLLKHGNHTYFFNRLWAEDKHLHFHKLCVYIFSHDTYSHLKTALLKSTSIHYFYIRLLLNRRNSRLEVLCEKHVPKNFAIFTGKYMCRNLFLIKLQVVKPVSLSKRESKRVLYCDYCKVFKNAYF